LRSASAYAHGQSTVTVLVACARRCVARRSRGGTRGLAQPKGGGSRRCGWREWGRARGCNSWPLSHLSASGQVRRSGSRVPSVSCSARHLVICADEPLRKEQRSRPIELRANRALRPAVVWTAATHPRLCPINRALTSHPRATAIP